MGHGNRFLLAVLTLFFDNCSTIFFFNYFLVLTLESAFLKASFFRISF